MVPFVVTYNLASITKMGYKDHDNDGIFVKIRGVDKDDNGEKHPLATQGPQGEVKSRFDTLADQIASLNRKLDIGHL